MENKERTQENDSLVEDGIGREVIREVREKVIAKLSIHCTSKLSHPEICVPMSPCPTI